MAKKRKTPQEKVAAKTEHGPLAAAPKELVNDIRELIHQTREQTAYAVNAALVLLYWEVGNRIRTEFLKEKRAGYGEEIVPTLSAQLVSEFGRGFSGRNLFRMIRFAEAFPNREILSTLSTKLSWSHFVEIIPLDDNIKREFYAEMCRVQSWTVRTLRQKIGGMLYERTALTKKPEELVEQEIAALRDDDLLTPDLVFQDPYFLDFLGLQGAHSEKDLEAAILREMEKFILELGQGFAFIERQKRMIVDGKDHYLDLLFYHRVLRRLIAIELKLESFEASHKGQMELYLRWLEKHELQPGELTPLGLILCTGKSDEAIQLLRLDESGIHVASYMTALPPRKLLQEKLIQAFRNAKAQLELRQETAD